MSAGLYPSGGWPSPLLTILALAASLSSQGVVTGRLVTPDGTAMANAVLVVVGRSDSVRSDRDGRFVWDPAPDLPATVLVLLSDGRAAGPIRLDAGPGDRLLTIDPMLAESIVVTGIAPGIDAAPGSSLTLLTVEDLQLRQPQTLSQAVDVVPGVGTISEGQGAVPAIRGLARGRTLVLVDGSRADVERRAGANASFLDPGAIQSVEIARGPGSVSYGSDALGGVITALTRKPSTASGVAVRGSLTGGWGLPQRRADLELSAGYGSGGLLIGGRARDFDDYDSPNGEVPNSQWRDHGVRARWDHFTDRQTWSLAWQSDWARDIGRPRSDDDVVRVTSPVDDNHRVTLSYVRARGALGFRNVRVDAMGGRSRQQTDQDRRPTGSRPRSLEQAEVSATDAQIRITADRSIRSLRLHTGFDTHGRYGLEALDTVVAFAPTGHELSRATQVSIADAHRTDVGLFVEADARLADRLRLTSGLRGDIVASRNTEGYFGSRTITHGAVTGLVAATVSATSRLTVTAQVARGFRDPMLSDRFYRGPVGRGFLEGNPELDPETSLQADVTGRYAAGVVQVALAGYHYRLTDLIERYAATPTLFLYRNRSSAVLRGVELEAQARLPHGFSLAASAEASKGEDPDTGAAIDDIAPPGAAVMLRHAAGDRRLAFVRVEFVGRHRHAGPSEVPTGSYVLLDAGVRQRVGSFLWVVVSACNLLDDAYQSSAGPRWVWAPGRQVAVTTTLAF